MIESKRNRCVLLVLVIGLAGCAINSKLSSAPSKENNIPEVVDTLSPLKPVIVTDSVEFDTDDPSIWIHPTDRSKSLVIGTDKETGGGIYAFDLQGKIVKKITGLQRPNNIDIAYALSVNGIQTDIAVFTERKAHKIRVVSLPDLTFIDNGGIPVFEGEVGEGFNEPMGIALYTAPDHKIFAIVGRKDGPISNYLWQYELSDGNEGFVTGKLVRIFGQYSGRKEIEAITVDNELGFVYFSDEQCCIRKYYADPSKGNEELASFGSSGYKMDHEGISIFKTSYTKGYLLISNQQDNSFMLYPREGSKSNKHHHELITKIPFSTIESDGSEVSSIALSPQFPKGLFVAMSNGKVFHYYDWRNIEQRILAASNNVK